MNEHEWLAGQFEQNRSHLRSVAYRMLGSLSEAEDAVQESWLRLSRSDASGIENLGGWLTTVVARVSLDMLRSRKSKQEEALDTHIPEPTANNKDRTNPEAEALLADSVGLALLVVLDTLTPSERLAFVLHDMFDLPFEEIASIVGRSPVAVRQLASRARRRVHGKATVPDTDLTQQRKVVDAFLAAMRAGDFDGLVAVLDPDVVVKVESAEGIREIHGARNWAKGALAFSQQVRFMQPALVDGTVGLVLAPGGRLSRAVRFTFAEKKVIAVDIVANPERLRQLDLGVLDS